MVEVTAAEVKTLREITGAGVMDCKRALIETSGDRDKAIEILRERGLSLAEKKSHRTTEQGLVECYIHAGGRIGAMVEVNCETDFVARTPDFQDAGPRAGDAGRRYRAAFRSPKRNCLRARKATRKSCACSARRTSAIRDARYKTW